MAAFFENTKLACTKLFNTFKKVLLAVKILMYVVPLIYYLVMCCLPDAQWFHFTFLGLMAAFGIFDTITTLIDTSKFARKVIKRIYVSIKIVVKGVVIAMSIYTLYDLSMSGFDQSTALNLVVVILNIILWVLTVIFEFVVYAVEKSIILVIDSVKTDVHAIPDKISHFKNRFFKKEESLDEDVVKRDKLRTKLQKYKEKLMSKNKNN